MRVLSFCLLSKMKQYRLTFGDANMTWCTRAERRMFLKVAAADGRHDQTRTTGLHIRVPLCGSGMLHVRLTIASPTLPAHRLQCNTKSTSKNISVGRSKTWRINGEMHIKRQQGATSLVCIMTHSQGRISKKDHDGKCCI